MTEPWSPTPLRNECLSIAKRLTDLADDLDGASSAWDDIENEHDKKPPPSCGPDGYPVIEPEFSCSYQATVMHMRALAESAKRAGESLPNSRVRPALPFAAMGLLHLMVWHGKKVGAIAIDSPSVLELTDICKECRIIISEEAFRNALRTAFTKFDRHYYPPGIWEIVSGD